MRLYGGKFGLAYRCGRDGCGGAHGAHPDGSPLGDPADLRTRRARTEAHDAFDRLWRYGPLSRSEAYGWMAGVLGVPREEAHIGRLDRGACARLVAAVKDEFPDLFPLSL
jgi:hypothetical protein